MTKLTEAQIVILNRAINKHKDIVPSLEKSGLTCDARAYASAISGLLKKKLIEQSGAATANDYSKDGWRFRVTNEGIFAYESLDEETLADFVDALEDDEEELEEAAGSRVKEAYKKRYSELKAVGGSGQGCADQLDLWIANTFMVPAQKGKRMVLDVLAFADFAGENGIDTNRYVGLNNGMIRMNVTNRLRAMVRKGQDIFFRARVVVKGAKDPVVEVKKAKRAKKADQAQAIAA